MCSTLRSAESHVALRRLEVLVGDGVDLAVLLRVVGGELVVGARQELHTDRLLGCASACRERFFGKYSMSTELCFGSRYIGWLAGS